jgi:hypothetical protein
LLTALCSACIASAQTKADSSYSSDSNRTRFKIETELEYLAPKDKSRDIQTVLVNVFVGAEKEFWKFLRLSIYGGVTLNYAWGNITQWDSNFQDVVYPNNAFGAGPVFLLRVEPVITKELSVSFDASGGFILYTSHFPAGGDIYNFMWRMGPSLIYSLSEQYSLSAGARWMHVSNGQGLNYHNPSYEAVGGYAGFVGYFK